MSVIEHFWYRLRPAHLVLIPLSLLFGAAVWVRRALYARSILRSKRLAVPVIVVGNISVGGTGKTPLVLWLAELLRAQGWRPGIVTRGYGGTQRVQEVTPDSDPASAGDEPLLLARRSSVPVFAGRQRAAAACALLAAHPECDVLIGDDGLQHYALARDIEIAVVDGERRFGNGWLLPAGPLREPVRRLEQVDAVVLNGGGVLTKPGAVQHEMTLHGDSLVNVHDPQRVAVPAAFKDRPVHALAGIGDPQRFFQHLRRLGLTVRPHPFPDHHAFTPDDLAFAQDLPLLMTEKDAVKCRAFARESWWYLPVAAQVDPALATLVLDKLKRRHGP
jgi:tetraacyldisaccharide 4'-kinase